MNEKVYSMTVHVGPDKDGARYVHTFWFRSAALRKQAYDKIQTMDLYATFDHFVEMPPATVKRMVQNRLHSPYKKRASS